MNLRHAYLNPETLLKGENFRHVESFLNETRRRNIGWHYAVDLTWIYARARSWPRHWRILDAGGGRGPLQFLLAEMGFDVVNLDLLQTEPAFALRERYKLEKSSMLSYRTTSYVKHMRRLLRFRSLVRSLREGISGSAPLRARSARNYAARHDAWRAASGNAEHPVGTIRWLVGNLTSMPEIEDQSFDAVVSLSSLEHVPLDILPNVMRELDRVVKKGGAWAITTSATEREAGWFHENSSGWCFSEAELDKYFASKPASADSAGEVLGKYRTCDYLKRNLAFSYRLSGKNGMPWGIWKPAYVPVGLWAPAEAGG